MDDEQRTNDQKVYAVLIEGRSVQVTDAEHVAYVMGLSVAQVKGALRRLAARGDIRMSREDAGRYSFSARAPK